MMGLPQLPGSPFRHAAPTTPMDRNGCSCRLLPHPTRAFPVIQAGRRPSLHFRGLLRLHSRYGLPDCSTAQRRPLSRGFDPPGCPIEPLVSYQSLPTTPWVDPPSTGEPRRWGAPNKMGFCNGPSFVNPFRATYLCILRPFSFLGNCSTHPLLCN